MFKNYYDILGIKPRASLLEVKSAYRALARKYHPDGNPETASQAMFSEVHEAYLVLSDDEQRRKYNERHHFESWEEEAQETREASQEHSNNDGGVESDSTAFEHSSERAVDDEDAAAADSNSESSEKRQKESPLWNQPRDGAGNVFAGPAGNRFTGRGDSANFLNKMRDLFGKGGAEQNAEPRTRTHAAFSTKDKRAQARPKPRKKSVPETLKGDREFTFTITARESLSTSFRQIAVKDQGVPRTIRVKIPAGVYEGDTLKVRINDSESVRVHIRIVPDELVERDGADIILKIPVTVKEALLGGEVEVPTPLGPVTVRLPAMSSEKKRLRLKGRGAPKPGSPNSRGDLFVKPYVVVPELAHDVVEQAATALEEYYLGSPRKSLPKKL